MSLNARQISRLTDDQLDAILCRTTYAESGVAIGADAATDQDMRRLVKREISRRSLGIVAECWTCRVTYFPHGSGGAVTQPCRR